MKQQSTAKVLHKASTPKAANKEVHIDKNGNVKPDPVEVHRHLREQVMWFADKGAATIEFSKTDYPFDTWEFHVPAGGSKGSGLVRGDAKPKRYDYKVKAAAGTNDPGVIIQN